MSRRMPISLILAPVLAVFAAACCLGAAPILALLAALGLSAVVSDAVLIPLLVAAECWTLIAIRRGTPPGESQGPFWLGVLAFALSVGGLWVTPVAVGAGLVCLVAAVVWHLRLRRNTAAC